MMNKRYKQLINATLLKYVNKDTFLPSGTLEVWESHYNRKIKEDLNSLSYAELIGLYNNYNVLIDGYYKNGNKLGTKEELNELADDPIGYYIKDTVAKILMESFYLLVDVLKQMQVNEVSKDYLIKHMESELNTLDYQELL